MYIEQLLSLSREEGWKIDAVGLSEGPGSYTGLRIGASTAKGLCYGMNIPLIPVPTLDVLCEAARENTEYRIQSTDLLCPMIDARRMEVYTRLRVTGDGLRVTGDAVRAVVVENEESLLMGDGIRVTDDGINVYYFGDGAAKCQAVLTSDNWHYIPDIVPEAQYVGVIAEKTERRISGTELAYYEPFYLKEFVAAQSHVKGLR